MNFKGRRCIQSHFVVFIFIGILVASLMFSIINAYFINDPVECTDIRHQVNDICRTDDYVRVTVENSGEISYNVNVYKESINQYSIPPEQTKNLNIYSNQNEITLAPIVFVEGEEKMCSMFEENIDSNRIDKC